MPRGYTQDQLTRMQLEVTRPIYLVHWQHSGTDEYLSCNGDVTYDSQAYSPGIINIAGMRDSRSATLWLHMDADRVTEIETGTWRGGVCKIYYIPGIPGETPAYTTADAFLALDGLIESTSLNGNRITVQVKNKYLTGQMSPVLTLDQVANHIPPAGSTIEYEGETVTLDPPSEGLVVGTSGGANIIRGIDGLFGPMGIMPSS